MVEEVDADISIDSAGETGREIFETDFLTIAPGLDEGLVFSEEGQVAVTQRKTLQVSDESEF